MVASDMSPLEFTDMRKTAPPTAGVAASPAAPTATSQSPVNVSLPYTELETPKKLSAANVIPGWPLSILYWE